MKNRRLSESNVVKLGPNDLRRLIRETLEPGPSGARGVDSEEVQNAIAGLLSAIIGEAQKMTGSSDPVVADSLHVMVDNDLRQISLELIQTCVEEIETTR